MVVELADTQQGKSLQVSGSMLCPFFCIFGRMRYLFLFIAVFFFSSGALVHGKEMPVKHTIAVTARTFDTNTQYNDPEIELNNAAIGRTAQAGQGWQKITDLLPFLSKNKTDNDTVAEAVPAIAPLFLSRNNYLFHNYPSHNFW